MLIDRYRLDESSEAASTPVIESSASGVPVSVKLGESDKSDATPVVADLSSKTPSVAGARELVRVTVTTTVEERVKSPEESTEISEEIVSLSLNFI